MKQEKETAVIYFLDTGPHHRAQLGDALYMPSYPHDIFSVTRATNGAATITFERGNSHMVTKDGSRVDIHKSRNLHHWPTTEESVDQCNVCHDLQTWHRILDHCTYKNVKILLRPGKGAKKKDIETLRTLSQ